MVKSNYKYISGKQLIKALASQYNLEIISQRGSHIKIRCNQLITVIPNHKEIAYGTFSGILKQLKIDEDIFLKRL